MGRHLRVILFVIAITLPGYVLSVENTPDDQHQSGSNTPDDQGNAPRPCSETSPEYKEASDQFLEAIKGVFTNAIEQKAQNIKVTLNDTSEVYLAAAEKCVRNSTFHKTWNYTVFIDLMEFAVKNVTELKEFKENKDGECIMNQADKIKDCIKTTAFKDSKKKYSGLPDLARLTFNELTCTSAASLKTCTLKVLQDSCKNTVNYVSNLFDHMQERCPKPPKGKSSSVRTSAFWVGFIVFVVEFTKRAM